MVLFVLLSVCVVIILHCIFCSEKQQVTSAELGDLQRGDCVLRHVWPFFLFYFI